MAGRTIKYSWLLLIGSLLFSQSMINRLRVPIQFRTAIGFGYDNNFLRLSEKEISEDDVSKYGISSTLDSPILKPSLKLIYSPAIIDGNTTNIVTSVSYSYFTQADQKSYLISNISMEMKLSSYSWIKVGIRDIPEYYLRNYHDRDLSNVDYYNCTFSSQRYFASYSLPIKSLRRIWIKMYIDHAKEYYNSHFNEFDLHKTMFQFDLNHKYKNNYKMKISLSHGNAENINYGSNLLSTGIDRSYIFDKVRGEAIINVRKLKVIDDAGISVQLEQRYYDLLSEKYSIGNWKYYLDGRVKVWANLDIIDNIGFKTYYQFRWRDASTQIYGDFEWVEDIKSYSKHEIWLEFSYKFVTDILY